MQKEVKFFFFFFLQEDEFRKQFSKRQGQKKIKNKNHPPRLVR